VKKAIILILCLALVFTGLSCDDGEDTDDIITEMVASGLVTLSDSYIEGYVNSLELLALTQEVRSGQWEVMEGLLEEVESNQAGALLWFALPDGSYYTVETGEADKNLSDRDYFPGLMDGNEVLGSLVYSKATGRTSIIAAVPVVMEEEVIGGLGASIFLDDLSTMLKTTLDLPDDMVFCATDAEDTVALHSDIELIFSQNPDLPEDAVSKTSPLTGWKFSLGFKD